VVEMIGPVVLAINPGSRSLKVAAHDASGARLFDRSVARPTADAGSAIADVVERLAAAGLTPSAVAHRVVHGGPVHVAPELVDDELMTALRALVDFAPLHLPGDLDSIEAARVRWPDLPHVACFDTAFHATMRPAAHRLPVPDAVTAMGIRRYGFHGLSVQWAAERVAVPRLVVCHLGGGCSVTAVRDGRSVDTTMGYSPLDGVPMATRSGSIDPEIPLHLLRARLLRLEELEHALEHESGLLGLSGVSGSVQELQGSDDPSARFALAVFSHRVAGAVAAMAASLRGLDALVFTAGIGENSASVRADVCGRLGFLGVELDPDRNDSARPDAEIAAQGAAARVVVLQAREDVIAARAARARLAI
jgi:acetate kinase